VTKPARPVDVALRALRARDRSAAELDERLSARGAGPAERREVLELLERVGYVDDERFAHDRAGTLAARGSGDALIRHDLEQRGIASETIEAALAGLEPEPVRAERVVARRGPGAKTARHLAARGFDEDAVASAVARDGVGEVE
jgi:regulatory protein